MHTKATLSFQIYENDGLPDRICEECLSMLNNIVSFKTRCQENDRILRESVLNIKREKYEIPDIKEEFCTEFDEDDFANFASDELDDVKPHKSIYNSAKKKTKKLIKKSINKKEIPDTIYKFEDDEKPLKIMKKSRRRRLSTEDYSGLCSFCGKIFYKLASLKAHLKLHTLEKTHACKKCSKAFRDIRNLKDHEKTHLNIKDFPCEVCGKLFSSRNSAKKHIDAVHRRTQAVTCSLCDKKLSSSRSLKVIFQKKFIPN